MSLTRIVSKRGRKSWASFGAIIPNQFTMKSSFFAPAGLLIRTLALESSIFFRWNAVGSL